MNSSKFDIEKIKIKNKIVDNAIEQLKKEFIGIDKQIDEIMDNVRTWYLFPNLQTRPLVVCIWGMSGTGKTALVKRISQLLEIEKDYIYFNFASISESSSWEIEQRIEDEIANEKSNRMFVYDEFQYAATINPKTGEEYEDKTVLKTFWELLDTGILHKRGDFWNVRTPLKVLEFMSKICLQCRMEIKNGIWINAEECLSRFPPYDISKFREVFNFNVEGITDKRKEQGKPNVKELSETSCNKRYEIPNTFDESDSFFIKESYLDKIFELYDKSSGQISDTIELYHRLEQMNCDEIIDFVLEVYNSSKKGYDLKFNDSIIFVIANLDEAYQVSFDVNPDMLPDQFRKITENINIVDVKAALQKRFRNEQITRLGNIQVIYPSFSEQNFKDIINFYLDKYKKEAFKASGYNLVFEDSVKKIIYDEGVYPTHGIRPVFSTIYEIVKSRFPQVIRFIYENDIEDKTVKIVYSFNEKIDNIVVTYKDKNDNDLSSTSFSIKLRLKKLRDSKTDDDKQALCALHESGHFVMYAKLFGKVPEKLVSRTTDSSTGGFLMGDIDNIKNKTSKRDMLNEIKVLLGGYVAEKMIFGEEMTMGASSDLFKATSIASKMVRRLAMGNNTCVTTWKVDSEDPYGLLINEDNQNYINHEIKEIISNAENAVRLTFRDEDWRKMLKESALYLCNNSAMPKEKMQEIYDKVPQSAKMSVRSSTFYRDMISEM